MRKLFKTKHTLIAAFILVAVLIIALLDGGTLSFAVTSAYSSVVDDLSKDKNFNLLDYSEISDDYSINIIQIAESDESELLIYVYQPSAGAYDLTLQSIRFSPDIEGTAFRDYKVTLLNGRGTLFKYRVEDFTVSTNTTRYYNITAVHRTYDKFIDGGSISSNKYSGIAVAVAQLWTAVTANGTVTYFMEKEDVVTITGFTYGTMRLDDGKNFISSYACDSHFVAFSTDVRIDRLLEADVSFSYRTVDVGIYNHPDYGQTYSKTVTVTYKEQGSTTGNHWGNEKRTWDRIMSSTEYINSFPVDEIPTNIANDIKKQKWVLSYYETEYEDDTGGVIGVVHYLGALFGENIKHSTEVSNVSILRLKFITDGVVYNLGVVCNIGGTSEVVADDSKTFAETVRAAASDFFKGIKNNILGFFKKIFGGLSWWKWVLIIIAILIAVPLLLSIFFVSIRKFCLTTLKAIGKVLKWLLKALWWIICLPFRLIKKLFSRRDE